MSDLLRDAPLGQILRYITRNKYLLYPEELPGFQCPCDYKLDEAALKNGDRLGKEEQDNSNPAASSTSDSERDEEARLELQRTRTLPYTADRLRVEQSLAAARSHQTVIAPTKTSDGTILVDWYNTNDPANPQNWSQKKKAFVGFQICLYTFVVYCGSSIYVAGELGVLADFGASETQRALGLALYVLGYGLGPLLWSPMSEIPTFGRNYPYVVTFAIYVVLAVPAALVNNMPGLLVLRFLQGFFGSPCLATGGASMQDMYSFLYLPYALAIWVSSAFAAPALGPILSGFAVVAKSWRWSMWEILWMSSPVFILWMFCLPETSAHTILLRRAERLRKLSRNLKIRCQAEIDRKGLTPQAIAVDAIIKPFEIMIRDPAVLYTNVYTALTYGVFYSFFESFSLIYGPLYGFNIGETGVMFICIVVGCFLGMGVYFAYLHYLLIPDILKNGMRAQESRLKPALFAVISFTGTLFAYGWLVNSKIHWMGGAVFLTINSASVYVIMQCIFVYIPMSYPQYAASLFASNDFCRSAFAFAAILFSTDMYRNLGIGQGTSFMAGLSVIGIIGMWLLFFYGAKLRARSSFAIS